VEIISIVVGSPDEVRVLTHIVSYPKGRFTWARPATK